MAIIDTFLMLFKADTSNVKKGTQESEKDLVKLGEQAKKTDNEISNIGKSFVKAAQSFAGLAAGFVSANAIISGFKESLNYTTEISNLSQELNLNVETVDAWGRALKRTGGNAQSFKNIIESLKNRYGGTSEQVFSQLPKFADSFSKLSKDQALIRGKQFGFDVPTILLLQQGRREIDALIARQEKLGVVTEKDKELTLKFNNALVDAGQAYNSFWRELSRPILPYLTDTINFLIDHQDLVKGAFGAIGAAVGILAIALTKANPLLAAASASIIAIAAVYDDVKAYTEGRPSVIGETGNALDKQLSKGSSLPAWLQKITGYNSLKSGGNDNAEFSNPFKNLSFPSFGALTGHNALSGNKTINIQKIEIITNATDSQGIGFSLIPELQKQFNQVADHFGSAVNI